ncbi:SDR family oxidoreductase [Hyphomonas sp.]|uniref:SDR family oxidoreductase n=1 Tax=Hyphomonas sp. TaxID=87 RepID=UPI003D2992A3
MPSPRTIAAIGCSGPVATHFIEGFLEEGANVRILARNPDRVQAMYPAASIISGSMIEPGDVARAVDGADLVFLVTPMGLNNDPASEIESAKRVIEGLKRGGSPHLAYTSCLGVDGQSGVGILDAKHAIEKLIEQSGVPYTIMRCGTYMEDLFDPRIELLRKGKFLFPLNRDRRFTFTRQRDVPRFILHEVLASDALRNQTLDLVAPGTYSIRDIEARLSEAAGFPVKAPPRFPIFHVYRALLPVFRARRDRMSSVIPLLVYFDRHGYLSDGEIPEDTKFKTTTLEQHLEALLQGSR